MGVILGIGVFSDLSLGTIFSLASQINGDIVFLFCLTMIGAAAAKSALIPLNVW